MNLPDWLVNIFSWFTKLDESLTYKGLFAVAATAFFMLYAQESSIKILESAISKNHSLFLTGASSSIFLLVFGGSKVIEKGWKHGKRYYKRKENREEARKKIENLSSIQKAILKLFFEHGSTTEMFFYPNTTDTERIRGELEGLVEHNILKRENKVGYYSIKPSARKYLKENFGLIEEANKEKIFNAGGTYKDPGQEHELPF